MKHTFIAVALFVFATSAKAENSYAFSALEKEMDRIANQYSRDSSELLNQMSKLLDNSPSATIAERALFLTYDCSIRARMASALAQDRLSEIKSLAVVDNSADVRAAISLCESGIASQKEDLTDYNLASIKAFYHVREAKLPTLRYWIGLNAYSILLQYNELLSENRALSMGLKVAVDNQDNMRLSTVHQLLAEHYLKAEQYELALNHNDSAQKYTELTKDFYYQGQIYTNRARVLNKLERYSEAVSFYKQAIASTKKHNELRDEQFIYLELAFTHLLLNNDKEAKLLFDRVSQYAKEYDDSFLTHLSNTYLYLRDRTAENLNKLNDAKQFFINENYLGVNANFNEQLFKILEIQNSPTEGRFTAFKVMVKDRQKLESTDALEFRELTSKAIAAIRIDDEEIAQVKLKQAKDSAQNYRQKLNVAYIVIFGVLIILGAVAVNTVKFKLKQRKQLLDEQNRQRFYDPLTNAFNRRYFDDILSLNVLDSCRKGDTSYIVLLDIDYFKSFNDKFGHSAGDYVLTELVKNLNSDSRFQDSIVRMGGEEFLLVIPPSKNLRIEIIIERMLKLISQNPVIIEDKPQTITISIGYVPVSGINEKLELEQLIQLADKALYVAKHNGRNRAVGIESLSCGAKDVDQVLVAQENELLTLKEITNSD